jgi:hypothetical protein
MQHLPRIYPMSIRLAEKPDASPVSYCTSSILLSAFKQSYKGDVVTPDDPGYAEAIARWASNAECHARVVAFVKDTDDVALAL